MISKEIQKALQLSLCHRKTDKMVISKICLQIQKALSPAYGGKPTVTMEETVARLSRAKVMRYICS